MLFVRAACALVLAAMIPLSSAEARPHDTAKAALTRLFRQPVDSSWFAPAFLSQVPANRVADIISQLTGRYGSLRQVSGSDDSLVAELERADIPTRIALDQQGRIRTLLFKTPIATGTTLTSGMAAIAALPGTTSALVTTDGKTVAAHDPDAVLAVGSAAKLAILAALDDAVAAGRLAWDQVVTLKPQWRSLPGSLLIGWPDGSPVTIATLRNLMISQSDNMATDALIDLVGRRAIEALTPSNTPFPTTAELFKLQASPQERDAWRTADAAGRRAIVAKLDGLPLPQSSDLADDPGPAEWFMTARELCRLLDRVAGSPAFTINPGVADPQQWQSVAFKGGSDSGVLNLSTRVVADDGTTHCVVVTWNNPGGETAIDTLAPVYRGLLSNLRGKPQ